MTGHAQPISGSKMAKVELSAALRERGGPETQVSFTVSLVPEPGSGFLVLTGLGGLLLACAIRHRPGR